MVVMMTTAAFVVTPQGLWVRLLKPGAVPQNSDPWTQPLVVLAKDAGPERTPNLYVNSKQVPWEDFEHVLKQELSRRREWVVYVGGDDTVPWQYVVDLLDTARKNHAKAYLLTGADKLTSSD